MSNEWLNVLGMKMKEAIDKYYYPDIEPQHISAKQCSELRTILSKVPDDDHELKKLIIKRIIKGRIEEVKQQEDILAFQVSIRHKKEMYLIELELRGLNWHVAGIQYTGKASQRPLVWGLSAALALSVTLFSLILLTEFGPSSVIADQSQPKKEMEANAYSLSDLKQLAKEHAYVLYTEEEFNEIVNLYIEEALANERKSTADNNTGQQTDGEETANDGEADPKVAEKKNDENSGQHLEETSLPETVTITVEPGMSSQDIAAMLVQENLARNEQELKELLIALDVEHEMRSGTFEIPRQSTYMEMINILTGEH